MTRLALVSCLALLHCTPRPASRLDVECDPFCLSETDVRLTSGDLLVSSPGVTAVFDDFLNALEGSPQCPAPDAGLATPGPVLWRRGISPTNGATTVWGSLMGGGRSGLAVTPTGDIALQAGWATWILDVVGTPRHALVGGREFGPHPDLPFVAFDRTTRSRLWVTFRSTPALVSLEQIDKIQGPTLVSHWQEQDAGPVVVESLAYSSPNVLSDGTLIWTSWAGRTRAQATDGGLKWEADAVEGVALVSDDDVTYWAGPTPIGRDRFGALVWEPRHPPEWRTRSIPQDEGTRVGPLIPVVYDALGVGGIVALHRRSDGEFEYSTSNLDGGLDGDPTRVGIAPDGTTFVSSISADSATAERRTILAAYDNQLRRRWAVESEPVDFGPIPGERSDRFFTVTSDCRVNVIDRNGTTVASHQLLGRAFRYLPKLVNGVLYVMAEVNVPEKITADKLSGIRPDGGVIDPERDYDCVLGRAVTCPPIEKGPFFILYALQVE